MIPPHRRKSDRLVIMAFTISVLFSAIAVLLVYLDNKDDSKQTAKLAIVTRDLKHTTQKLAAAVNETQRSRLEASKNSCVALGRTNYALIDLLEESARRARDREPQPGDPSREALRRLLDRFEKPLKTPGAVPDLRRAEVRCEAAAVRIVKPSPPVAGS